MQKNIGIWNINDGRPNRLQRGGVGLEKDLENWLEQDPSLIRADLIILGRQINLDSGLLDLLAMDQLGNWCVIEIKRGNVRRETVTQAIDYAACIKDMGLKELESKLNPYLKRYSTTLKSVLRERGIENETIDDRNIIIFVVGTGRDINLERMTKFLSGVVINVVNFEVFEASNGQRIILRELTELDTEVTQQGKSRTQSRESEEKGQKTIESLCAQADRNGIGKEFRLLLDAAIRNDIYPRPFKTCIMYTPLDNKTRYLFTVYTKPTDSGLIGAWLHPEAFAEFYPISEREVIEYLGKHAWYEMDFKGVESFVQDLNGLFEIINKNS